MSISLSVCVTPQSTIKPGPILETTWSWLVRVALSTLWITILILSFLMAAEVTVQADLSDELLSVYLEKFQTRFEDECTEMSLKIDPKAKPGHLRVLLGSKLVYEY